MTLRERIKNLCQQEGISANQLEKDCGFAKGYVSKLDKSTPNSEKLQKIADYLGVSLDYLMNGKEPSMNEFSKKQALLDVKISQDLKLKSALEKYFSLPEKKQKHVIELIELLAEVKE